MRVESLRKENDLLAAWHHSQRAGQVADGVDFALDLPAHLRLVGAGDRMRIGTPYDRLRARWLASEAKGVRASERCWVTDRRRDELAIGRKCRDETKSVIRMDRGDSDEVARAGNLGQKAPCGILSPRPRARGCIAEVEKQDERTPCRRIDWRKGTDGSIRREIDDIE